MSKVNNALTADTDKYLLFKQTTNQKISIKTTPQKSQKQKKQISFYLSGVDGHVSVVAEDDVLGVVHDGVFVHHFGRAEGLLDLALHVLRRV